MAAPVGTTAPVDLDLLDRLVGYALRRAQLSVYQDFTQAIGVFELRPAQFAAMVVIAANPGLSQTALAVTLNIDRSGLVTLIDSLEARGLAARLPAPGDRRSHAIFLTAAGQGMLAGLKQQVAEHERRVTARLSGEETRLLVTLLRRLYQP